MRTTLPVPVMMPRLLAFTPSLPVSSPADGKTLPACCNPRPLHQFAPPQPVHTRRPSNSPKTVTCAHNGKNRSKKSSDPAEEHMQTYVTVELAERINSHALQLLNNDTHAVARQCARGFVDAFAQCYSTEHYASVFLVCGTGMNGLIGLYSAMYLKQKSYEPVIYSSPTATNKFANVTQFASEHDIPLYDFVPSTLSFYFSVVVDALLGLGFDGGDIRPHFWQAYEYLISCDLPIASIDVPSGWDLTLGPREVDRTADTFIKPDLLVSLAAPKLCAKTFKGEFHFIAGRHVPHMWLVERGVLMPAFPGDDCESVLFESNPRPFGKRNGEVFEQPGTFNATMYTKNPRRKWVDVEEDDELWDELD